MSPRKRDAKKHAKARQRRRLQAQERLARDCRQAQYAVEALQQALDDLSWMDAWQHSADAVWRCPRR
jgi:hypothetical protein